MFFIIIFLLPYPGARWQKKLLFFGWDPLKSNNSIISTLHPYQKNTNHNLLQSSTPATRMLILSLKKSLERYPQLAIKLPLAQALNKKQGSSLVLSSQTEWLLTDLWHTATRVVAPWGLLHLRTVFISLPKILCSKTFCLGFRTESNPCLLDTSWTVLLVGLYYLLAYVGSRAHFWGLIFPVQETVDELNSTQWL